MITGTWPKLLISISRVMASFAVLVHSALPVFHFCCMLHNCCHGVVMKWLILMCFLFILMVL